MKTEMTPEVIRLHGRAIEAELYGFHGIARAIRQFIAQAMLVALPLVLSGCVTQLPQTASPEVYENHNRARYGTPTATKGDR